MVRPFSAAWATTTRQTSSSSPLMMPTLIAFLSSAKDACGAIRLPTATADTNSRARPLRRLMVDQREDGKVLLTSDMIDLCGCEVMAVRRIAQAWSHRQKFYRFYQRTCFAVLGK